MSKRRLDLILDMLEKDSNDTFLIYAAALEYQKEGNQKKAVGHLENLTVRFPDYLAAYYTLGKIYENTGEFDKAITTYKKGKEVAKKQKDEKTIGELTEALMLLDEEEDNW